MRYDGRMDRIQRRMAGAVAAIAVSLVLLPASRAETPVAAAKRHYDAGTTAYNLGDFITAANEYREAYKARPLPAILYNIAQAYRLGGDLKQAVFFYRSYLRNVPDSPNRAECEERISVLEAQIAAHPATSTTPPRQEPPPSSAPPPVTAPSSSAPPPAAAPAPTSPLGLTATAPASERRPASKKWVWGVVAGAVVIVGVGLGVGLALGLTSDNAPPAAHFGTSVF
jgi:tetratricopeptide (TPR) repeat protein